MAIIATPFRRRVAMAALLLLAIAGGVIRHFAENPSTLRDVGTLMLVLWLPAVGNLIAYLVRKMPKRVAPANDFAEGSAFTPHLAVRVQALDVSEELLAAIGPSERRCIVLVGTQAFRARLAEPVARMIRVPGTQALGIELLRPAVGLVQLPQGTEFHLLAGTTAVAKGQVVAIQPAPA